MSKVMRKHVFFVKKDLFSYFCHISDSVCVIQELSLFHFNFSKAVQNSNSVYNFSTETEEMFYTYIWPIKTSFDEF
jgi:hypothetical protein